MPVAEFAPESAVRLGFALIFVIAITRSGKRLPLRHACNGDVRPFVSRYRRGCIETLAGAVFATISATMKRVPTIRRVLPWLAALAFSTAAFAQTDPSIQSLDAIRTTAQTFVTERVPKQSSRTVSVNVGALDSRLRLAPCAEPLRAALPAGATFRDRMTIGVSCTGPSSWTVYVPISIETQAPVLVLRRAAGRGERLGAGDVEIQTRLVQGTGDSYLTDVEQLSGRTLKRPLGAGAALTVDAMAADLIVRRGQQVTLLASVGGLEVRATGVAMNDAPAGGRAKVQNISSQRIVEGVVETADVIRISP
jgi:flagella basal body P-ring formation protein FlgA